MTCKHPNCPGSVDDNGPCLSDQPIADHAATWRRFYVDRARGWHATLQRSEAEVNSLRERLFGPRTDRPVRLNIRRRIDSDGIATTYAAKTVTVGSNPSCHIVIPELDPIHAAISRQAGGYLWIMNLNTDGLGVRLTRDDRQYAVDGGHVVGIGDVITLAAATTITIEDC